jgi:hypothetical protein
MSHFTVGTKVTLEGTFKNKARELDDPTTVTVRIEDPDGVVTVIEHADITRVSLGVYEVDVLVNREGTWWYRFEGDGDLVTAGDDRFRVMDSRFVA